MSLLTYKPLVVNTGELKFITSLATSAENGVTQDDLDAAELYARDRINLWIVKVAGRVAGAAIVAEFLAMADSSTVDPAIRHLAEKMAATRILRLMEQRNFINQGPQAGDQLRRKDWKEVADEAVELGEDIRHSKVTIKADGTVRSWGMGNLTQGPVVTGPMREGSLFDDIGYVSDNYGHRYRTPHRHPLDYSGDY